MRHLLVIFYAFVFSFGHSEAPRRTAVPQVEAGHVYTYAPTRYELAHPQYASS